MGTVNIFGYSISEDLLMVIAVFVLMTGILIVEMMKARYYKTAAVSLVHAYKDLMMNIEIAGIDLPKTVIEKPTQTVVRVEKLIGDIEDII